MATAAAPQPKAASREDDRARAPPESAAQTATKSSKALADRGRSSLLAPGASQGQGFVSSPNDAAEVEADRIAQQVVAKPDPAPRSRAGATAPVQRAAARAPRPPASVAPSTAPRAAIGGTPADAAVLPAVRAAASGGAPLSRKTRAFLEPRFGADFSGVRIHTGPEARLLATQLAARAFTYGRHIFFNDGEYQPDTPAGQKLLAHELTHTIQQREVIQRKALVQQRTAPHVQRGVLSTLGGAARAVGGAISDAAGAVVDFVGDVIQVVKDFIADKATIIPGFRLLCLILGRNPINDAATPGGGRAILQELTGFMPFGDKVLAALTAHGIIDKGGAFIDEQLAAFKRLVSSVTGALGAFFSSLGPRDAVNPGGAWERAKSIFTAPLNELKSFAGGLVSGFVSLVREVILKPLGRWAAANVPKWDLLMAVLGKNPVSDEGESPAAAVIGAFMNLIGQGEIWSNIQKAKAIPRAWQWFQNALKGAKALVSQIPGLVVSTIKSLTIVDVITIAGAFRKIVGAFGSFVGSLFSWAGGTVLSLLEIILSVVAPGAVPYLKKAGGAFSSIIRNPIGFVRTLVAAGKAGFQNFAGNFLNHLKAALIGWLTGSLSGAGVYIPKGFTVLELLKFVLSVLGLTWANIRAKLVRATNETTVKALETGFAIVKTLVTEGPAAAWQEIVKSLTNLKQMAIDAVMDFVKSKIVQVAVTKLLSMLSPAGAFIQALIAIYNTIMFFVERIRQIAQVAAAFIDSIAAIAAGNIGPAAVRVEKTLAGLLVLVISFLARLAGLGKVSDAVLGLVKKIRAPIDKALDKVVAWIVAQAKKLGSMILQAGAPTDPTARVKLAVRDAKVVARTLRGKAVTKGLLDAALAAIKTRYSLNSLEVFQRAGAWWGRARINPDDEGQLTEKEQDLAKRIREIADAKIKQLQLKKTTGSGSHEDPIIMPVGTGVVSIAKAMDDVPLGRGRVAHFDVTQGGSTELRGVVQRPAFGDAVISGATNQERRVDVGRYTAVVAEIRARFGPNDTRSAAIILDVLHGASIPQSMQEHAGWIGGLKVLAAQEIRRDPVAMVTLPANMELVRAGQTDMNQVFVQGGPARAATGGSPGGTFSHSPVGAKAALRGAREDLGMPLPADAPASRGTAATRAGAIAVDAETVTRLAMLRLKTKNEPPNDEIAQVVEEEIAKIAK